MEQMIDNLKKKFKEADTVFKFIYVNAAIFFLFALVGVIMQLFNREFTFFYNYLALPASFTQFFLQPWSIISYMFMHAGIIHILFNMLWLYWFGQIFLQFFSAIHLRGLYFLGGICGGLLYMISYNVFPYFHPMIEHSTMVGASASVLGIVIATAYREPNYPIRLFLFGVLRLKYLAAIVVISDLFFITSSNAGGHIAHLGGALAGLWFASSLSKGKDVTRWINNILDFFVRIFTTPFKKKPRKPKMKVYKGKREEDYNYNAEKKQQSEEVDRILDKLKKSGYASLTEKEKKALFDASKK